MAFTKKTWLKRIAEYANRRDFTLTDSTVLTGVITRNEGTVTQDGDAFNATNMNNLESRIFSGFATKADGSKNLVKNTASTSTINGITFTVNSDKSVTANGTATADAIFAVGPISYKTGNSYTMTGCPTGGSTSTYFIASAAQLDTGSGVTFGSNATSDVQIVVMSGTTISSKVFYPMVRYADVADSTYEAYCPSVPEVYSIANALNTNANTLKSVTSSVGTVTGGYMQVGKIVFVNIAISLTSAVTAGSTVLISGLPASSSFAAALSGINFTDGTIFLPYMGGLATTVLSFTSIATGKTIRINGLYFAS